MAKKRSELDPKQIEAIVNKYETISKSTASTSDELIKVSREIKKAVALLEAGFIKTKDDAEDFIEKVNKGLKVTDAYAKKLAENSDINNFELNSVIKKFRIIEKLDAKKLERQSELNDLLYEQNDILEDELDFTGRLLVNQKRILEVVQKRKKDAELFSNELQSSDDILKRFIGREVDLAGMLDDPISRINDFEDMVSKVSDDLKSMINFAQNQSISLDLNFDPFDVELDKQLASIKSNIDKEKKYRLDALAEYFKESETTSSSMSKKIAADMSGGKIKFDIDTGEIQTKKGSFMPGDQEYEKQAKVLEKIAAKNDLMSKTSAIQKEILAIYASEGDITEAQVSRLEELKKSMSITDKIMLDQVEQRIFQ
jgi:hypothetical protein